MPYHRSCHFVQRFHRLEIKTHLNLISASAFIVFNVKMRRAVISGEHFNPYVLVRHHAGSITWTIARRVNRRSPSTSKKDRIMTKARYFLFLVITTMAGLTPLAAEHEFKIDPQTSLNLDLTFHSYFMDDQCIQWSGLEVTFGSEAAVGTGLGRDFGSSAPQSQRSQKVLEAAVAGLFNPAEPSALAEMVSGFIDNFTRGERMLQTPHIECYFTAGETVLGVVIGITDGRAVLFAPVAGPSGADVVACVVRGLPATEKFLIV